MAKSGERDRAARAAGTGDQVVTAGVDRRAQRLGDDPQVDDLRLDFREFGLRPGLEAVVGGTSVPVLCGVEQVGTGLVGQERLAALEAECARLVALGAVRVRLLPADGDNESCLVMQDIEGNEFCLA
ncbi:VOC family protein [Micromonospora sp. NPDC047548]|uniref:VOC family protein n=1 Tax=Micromonospora sp. NPDC047548 TaxID=3155624 RepID=UPI0033C9E41D